MLRRILAVAAGFLVLWQDGSWAQGAIDGTGGSRADQGVRRTKHVELAWDELAAFVVEKKISTVLPDGTKVQGEALAVRPESLVLDVQKTSSRKAWPKGQTEIPRTYVSELNLIRERGAAMRILGGVAGAIGGLFGVSAVAYVADSAAFAIVGLVFLVPLAAVGGYYAGRLADRYTTRIVIRGAPPAPAFDEEED
jgi:hypothetical protein